MSENVFTGFPSPTRNFFSMPNEMINIIAHITNMSELKILLYIIRHTWGFHEYGVCKVISTDEFMNGRRKQDGTRMDEGTGLSNRSVIDGLRAAEKHGYLISITDDSDKARTVKSYALKMDESAMKNVHMDTYEECSQVPMKNVHRGSEDTSQASCEVSSQRSEKDTRERHYRKTDQRHESISQDATALATHTHENVISASMTSQSTKGHAQNENDSHSHDGSGNPDRRLSATDSDSREGTTNGGGLNNGRSNTSTAHLLRHNHRKLSSGNHGEPVPQPQEVTPPVVVESPLPPLVATPTSLDTDKPVRPQRKPKAVKDATVAASPMPQCDVHELRRRINAHRGYALEEKIEIIRENQATKAWSALHTLDDYETVMRELACDPYWGKPENISRVGGVTLQKETPRLLAKVRTGNRQPATGSAYSAEIVTRFGTATSRAEFAAEFYPSEAERRMQYAAK